MSTSLAASEERIRSREKRWKELDGSHVRHTSEQLYKSHLLLWRKSMTLSQSSG
ncbi:hypothetical protein PHLCEN_2v3464 [Hermanssonia centrifuga]|uniref:Uncharacterized protein n=1 Tax=Hermanssonia centrifuga TaxID=98765 RepID=A0A2R6QIN4_9APHY|nr:hypothetical protein PHLCEN_2v3464 [Hermanssonia centrifuga]